MRRPLATGACALIVALAAGILSPSPTTLAASSCTGWESTLVPPSTIRVFRTSLGRVEMVPFRRYVETVLAAEWGPTNPSEALAAGAVAVKQYGWYHALAGHWRGGSVGGRCFDVRDTSVDQVYLPGIKVPTAKHKAAVAESWPVTLRKPNGRFFMTSYNGGAAYARCGAGVTGWKLWQRGATACARAGYTFESILRLYYGPGLRVVTAPRPPAKTAAAVGLLIDRDVPGTEDALVLWSDGRSLQTTSDGVLRRFLDGIVEHVFADLDGDGRPDLAALLDGPLGPQIRVATATKRGLSAPATVWDAAIDGPALLGAGLRLVAADWDGDGRTDLGLVAPTPGGGGDSGLYELHIGKKGRASAVLAWTGPLGGNDTTLLGADFTGDGRGDLVAVAPSTSAPGELSLVVLPSRPRGGDFGEPHEWAAAEGLSPETVVAVAGDVDADGRDDVLLLSPSSRAGLTVRLLRATHGSFSVTRATAVGSGFTWAGLAAGTADLDRDGRADLWVFTDVDDGSVIRPLLSGGSSLGAAEWGDSLDLFWSTLDAH